MKKIMFNDKYMLTDAVFRGVKTTTRRDELNKEEQVILNEKERLGFKPQIVDNHIVVCNSFGRVVFSKKTRYKVGEVVAVAQSYKDTHVRFIPEEDEEFGCHEFPAEQTKGWNNKMFVRADLMPHRIRITNVRVQRLQDISDEDCIKEGIFEDITERDYHGRWMDDFYYYENYGEPFDTPSEAYADLIDKVSGEGTWERNPYVIVYDFELVK